MVVMVMLVLVVVVVTTQMGMSLQAVMAIMTMMMMMMPMFINMWKATEREAIRIIPLPYIYWQQFEGNCGKA
jgi:hypothetical protein